MEGGLRIGSIDLFEKFIFEEGWLKFSSTDIKFTNFLETVYFPPGTPKNEDFEIFMGPFRGRLAIWYRIKDSAENRVKMKNAFETYSQTKFDEGWELKMTTIQLQIMADARDYIDKVKGEVN